MNKINARALLRDKRRRALMPQIEVARQIGVSQSKYSYLESGYLDPNAEQARKLIELFDLPETYFDKEEADDAST